jgi:hypothetical protein
MADKPVAATLRDVDRAAKSEADVANSKDTALRTPGHETHPRPVTPGGSAAPTGASRELRAPSKGDGKLEARPGERRTHCVTTGFLPLLLAASHARPPHETLLRSQQRLGEMPRNLLNRLRLDCSFLLQ